MSIDVRPVRTARERRIFLTFPWYIYKDDPLWVPPLLPERASTIDREKGAWFERGDADLFIAWREDEPVGTMCAGEDRYTNELRGRHECVFGFLDYIEDYSVFEALIATAGAWARSRNLDTLFGPFNLDYENGYGVLIEGRDRPPTLLCGHSPPYYQGFMERHGFASARGTNIAMAIDIQEMTPQLRRLAQLADRVRERRQFVIREPDLDHWDDEVDRLHRLLNRALAHLPDHIGWHRSAVEALVAPFREIADMDMVLFADVVNAEGECETVGFLPGVPNLNEVFIHVNGLRYPWNYLRLLWDMRVRPLFGYHPACLTIKSVLVLPEYWGAGVAALLFDTMRERARAKGYAWVDLSITSEDNPQTPILGERMGAEVYKRWQVYRLGVDAVS
ncbi:MAG: GNAT family N-acetyltransferase [Anaerolineae bacterium]